MSKMNAYTIKKPFPKQNYHYNRVTKVVGNVDLNEQRFVSEYKK